jgi:hypothetical protein
VVLALLFFIDGDGNDRDVYYTSGDRLANDVARLRAEVWLKPRHGYSDGIRQFCTGHINVIFIRTGKFHGISLTIDCISSQLRIMMSY